MIPKNIVYSGKRCVLACDGKCHKAWGANNRPRIAFDDEDNYAYLPDDDVLEAPIDPGTYEGTDGKPRTPEPRLNKWCARECERSVITEVGKPIVLREFSTLVFNEPWKHEEGKL